MIRYIIEKFISYDYGHGYETIAENGVIKTFCSPKSAMNWLIENDKDFMTLPILEASKIYNIKPYVT